jgi:hypothetical protein
MFTNTEKRIKCEFQGATCTGISTIEMLLRTLKIYVCGSCCIDIENGKSNAINQVM